MVKPVDRRRSPRYVKIGLTQANSYLIGQTANLSLTGALIQLHNAMPVGSQVQLDLAIGRHVVEIPAEVVRVSRINEVRFEIGLQFLPLEEDDRLALLEFLVSEDEAS